MFTSDVLGVTGSGTAGAAITQDAAGRYPVLNNIQNGSSNSLVPVSNIVYASQSAAAGATSGSDMWYYSGSTGYNNGNPTQSVPFLSSTNNNTIITVEFNSSAVYFYTKEPLGASYYTNNVTIDTGTCYFGSYAQLSNGNVAMVYQNFSQTELRIAIQTSTGAIVLSPTNIYTNSGGNVFDDVYTSCVALSGGGFAVLYQYGGQLRIGAYDNSGNATFALTQIATGVSQTPYRTPAINTLPGWGLVALSNGNFAVVYLTSATTTLKWGIYSSTGATVVPLTSVTVSSNTAALITAMTGYFMLDYTDGSGVNTAVVFNNSGVQQGSAYTWPTTIPYGGTLYRSGITNDGTYFYSTTFTNSNYKIGIAKIPVTGAGSATTTYVAGSSDFNVGSNNGTSNLFAWTCSNGVIAVANAPLRTVTNYGVFAAWQTSNFKNLGIYVTFSQAANQAISAYPAINITYFSDGWFTAVYPSSWPGSYDYYWNIKPTKSAIYGVATSTASAGDQVSYRQSGPYGQAIPVACQTMYGTPTSFDHTGAGGAKGYLMTNIATVKGL